MIIINIFYSKLNFFLSLNNAWPAPKFFYQKKKTGRLNGNGRYHQDLMPFQAISKGPWKGRCNVIRVQSILTQNCKPLPFFIQNELF